MNFGAICQEVTRLTCQIGQDLWLKSQTLHSAQIREKAPGDMATELDVWAECSLRQALQQLLPDCQFMGEETGGSLSDAPTWIVDPIDGTANFVHGYPQWSVSVSLAREGEPVLGVIVDPSRQETFFATRGQGAWLESRHGLQRLSCAKRDQPLKCLAATVFPKPLSPWMPSYLNEFEQIIRAFGQVRRSGSMALELAYLAAGRVDVFWERGMQAWDAAAGIVLLREAGAQIVALDDLPLLASDFLAAATPDMLPVMLEILQRNAPKK